MHACDVAGAPAETAMPDAAFVTDSRSLRPCAIRCSPPGEEDPLVPWAASQYLARHLPHAVLHSIPKEGHGIAASLWGRIVLQLTEGV